MIEQHYAGVIANWDGKQRPAERLDSGCSKGLHRAHVKLVDANGRASQFEGPNADDKIPWK